MIQLAIVDDDIQHLRAISSHFNSHAKFCCAFTATSGQELWDKLEQDIDKNLRFLLMDIILVDESGLDWVAKIYRRFPHVEIIMCTVIEDTDALTKAFASGASGYLLKSHSFEEIDNYLTIALNGGAAISTTMARKLIDYFRPRPVESGKMGARTLQALHFLAEGWSYKMIADKMGISIDGVRFHIKEIYRTLNVQSKPQAVRKYLDGDY